MALSKKRSGEMRLELRCLLLFGFFFFLVTGASFGMWWYVTETIVWDQSPKTGHVIAYQAMLSTHWERLEALSDNEQFVPVIRQLRQDLNRRLGFDGTLDSSRGAIRSNLSHGQSVRTAPIRPVSPNDSNTSGSELQQQLLQLENEGGFNDANFEGDSLLPESSSAVSNRHENVANLPKRGGIEWSNRGRDSSNNPRSKLKSGGDETPSWEEEFAPDEVHWNILSVDPNCTDPQKRPERDFEKQVIAEFAGSRLPETSNIEYREEIWSKVYHYYEPIRASQSCSLICHRSDPDLPGVPAGAEVGGASPPGRPFWDEGEVMGIVHVEIPTRDIRDQVRFWWNVLLSVAIVMMFLAIIAFYVTIRYLIVRPLRHLRDVTDAISRGNIYRRADLHSGDVFETLGEALNRMLRHLVAAQEELRLQSRDLDVKVDQLARANMHLHEMNRIKSDFLATMSHELRTPLNSILGFSDVLSSINSLTDKQRRYVTNINKSGRLLLEMINDVLDLAKIESGRLEPEPMEFHIEEVIAAQCDIARPLSEHKNIDLESVVAPNLPPCFQDRNRVQQIVQNLLSNAIKFTPDGGRVRITVQQNGDGKLELRVLDTGIGIAEEDQQLIFEKFRQGKPSAQDQDVMTREYSGTGLGLSIVRELCRLLGGDVSVESELGTGSIFTVILPWRWQRRRNVELPPTDVELGHPPKAASTEESATL